MFTNIMPIMLDHRDAILEHKILHLVFDFTADLI